MGLDAIWPGQQRHVLAGQQLAGQHRAGDRIQRGHRRGQRADHGGGLRPAQHPDADQPGHVPDGGPDALPAGELLRVGLLRRPRRIEVQHPGVGRHPGRGGSPPGEHELVAVRAGPGVVQGDAGGGGPVEFPDRDEAGLPGGGRRIGLQAGLAGELIDLGVHGWLLPSGIWSCHCRPGGPGRACVLVPGPPRAFTVDGGRPARDSRGVAGGGPGPGRGGGELAGREQEPAELRGRRAAALAGHGALAMVTGPPGIGKTRLAEELAGQARQDGQRVLWGRGVEDQGAPPLWMWRRILGAVGGDDAWGQLTGDGAADGARSDDLTAARYRAAAAAADAITAAADQDGLLVVLEDLHWADQASLFLLRELAAELPQSRLLVLATSREATDGPARAALGDLARLPGLHMLRLGALDEAALAGILRAAGVTVTPELARVVRAHARGNPLYVTTLARLLVTEPGGPLDEHTLARIVGGSPEVSGLVRSLLRGLDDEACAVLAAASVLGEAFDPALVADVGPESAEVLRAPAAPGPAALRQAARWATAAADAATRALAFEDAARYLATALAAADGAAADGT